MNCGIVARPCCGIAQSLIGLVKPLCPDFCLAMQGRRMTEAIWMPDLNLFMPGFFQLSIRCVGREFEQCIVVGRLFIPHR